MLTTMSLPPAQHCLTLSNPITVDIPASPVTKQLSFIKLAHIDVPPNVKQEEAASLPKHVPDIRDYPQHELDDLDPERERKRQENVETTLRMIDDALKYSI